MTTYVGMFAITLLTSIIKHVAKYGMEINLDKTKVITMSGKRKLEVELDGQ